MLTVFEVIAVFVLAVVSNAAVARYFAIRAMKKAALVEDYRVIHLVHALFSLAFTIVFIFLTGNLFGPDAAVYAFVGGIIGFAWGALGVRESHISPALTS